MIEEEFTGEIPNNDIPPEKPYTRAQALHDQYWAPQIQAMSTLGAVFLCVGAIKMGLLERTIEGQATNTELAVWISLVAFEVNSILRSRKRIKKSSQYLSGDKGEI